MQKNGDRNKAQSIEEYIDKVRPYLNISFNDLKKSDAWKIQFTIAINYISSKDNVEERVMYS